MYNVSNDGDYFISDALQVSQIQKLITNAGEKGVKVLLITDACRAGKFVGDNKGALYTTSALIREWQHVLKLVSCQAEQGSLEGEMWGKGHGVFTFYLLNGLKGLADENNDGVIKFGEIADYVKSNVKKKLITGRCQNQQVMKHMICFWLTACYTQKQKKVLMNIKRM